MDDHMKQDSSISWIDLRFFLREKYTFFLTVVLVQPGNYLPVDIMCSKLPAQSGTLTPSVHMHASPLAGAPLRPRRLLSTFSVTVDQIRFRQHRKLSCHSVDCNHTSNKV